MTVSIVIPVYNAASYIERCIRSIMNQTYQDIEVIIVDDCGTDNSMSIARELISAYKGVIEFRLLSHDYNKGAGVARNTGIEAANGEWIFFLDNDDELPHDSIKKLVEKAYVYYECDIIMGATKAHCKKDYYDIFCYKHVSQPVNKQWLVYNSFNSEKVIPVNLWNKLIRRSFLIENKLYCKPGIIHEDNLWMFYVIKNVRTLIFVFEETYIHYRNEGSIMSTITKDIDTKDWIMIMSDIFDNLYEPFKHLQLLYFINMYFSRCIYTSKHKNMTLHYKFIRECIKTKLFRTALMLCLWSVLCNYRNGGRFQYILANYVKKSLVAETKKCKSSLTILS